MVIIVGIVLIFAALITTSIIIAVVKGFRAGETDIEIQIFGIMRFHIYLSEVCKKRTSTSACNAKKSN